MNARQISKLGMATALFFAAGCQPTSKTPPTTSLNPPQPPPGNVVKSSAPVDTTSADSSTPLPEALARKTAEYARNMEGTTAQTPSPAEPARDPSPVRWPAPRRPKFLEHPPEDASANKEAETAVASVPAPAPVPTVSPTPVARATAAPALSPSDASRVAVLAHSAKANPLTDVPAIMPESSDFASNDPAAPPDALGERLAKRVHQNPRDVAAQLDYQLYEMLNDNPASQLASVAAIPNEDGELVAAMLDGVGNFRASIRQDPNMVLSKKIRPILDMADRVRTEAELAVPTVALCKRVEGFGRYEPIDPARFPAGRDNPVIVYCEIENFKSRFNDKRLYETSLTQQVTLFTDTGQLVWKDKQRNVSDECRNRRHDFFLYDLIKLPANLSIGRYLLKVTIIDREANRVAESTVPVQIDAQ